MEDDYLYFEEPDYENNPDEWPEEYPEYGRMHGDRDSAVPDYDDPIYQG